MVCLLLAGNLSLRKIYFPVEWYAFSPFKRKFLGDFLHFYASMDIKKVWHTYPNDTARDIQVAKLITFSCSFNLTFALGNRHFIIDFYQNSHLVFNLSNDVCLESV